MIILGYPLDGPYTVTPGKIRERIRLRGPDIYEQGSVLRDVYTVRAVVRSGNSGGPMITPTGGWSAWCSAPRWTTPRPVSC